MKPRTDPSCPDYRRPENADDLRAEYTSGSGRRASKKIPVYTTLRDLGVRVTGKTIDLASMPLATTGGAASAASPAEPVLDMARVEAELLRGGKHAPSLSTIAVRCVLELGRIWLVRVGCSVDSLPAPLCLVQRGRGVCHVRHRRQRGRAGRDVWW